MRMSYEELRKDQKALDTFVAFWITAKFSEDEWNKNQKRQESTDTFLLEKKLFLTIAQKYDIDVELSDEEYKKLYDLIQKKMDHMKGDDLYDLMEAWVKDEKTQKIVEEISSTSNQPVVKYMTQFLQQFSQSYDAMEQAPDEAEKVLQEHHFNQNRYETTFSIFSYFLNRIAEQNGDQISSEELQAIAEAIYEIKAEEADAMDLTKERLQELNDREYLFTDSELLEFYLDQDYQDILKKVVQGENRTYNDRLSRTMMEMEEGIWERLRKLPWSEEEREVVDRVHADVLAFQKEMDSLQKEEDRLKELIEREQEEIENRQREEEDLRKKAERKEALERYNFAKAKVDSLTTQEAVDDRVASYLNRPGDGNHLKQYLSLAKYELNQAKGTYAYEKLKQNTTAFLKERMIPVLMNEMVNEISDYDIEGLLGRDVEMNDWEWLRNRMDNESQYLFETALEEVYDSVAPVMWDEDFVNRLKSMKEDVERTDPILEKLEELEELHKERLKKQSEYSAEQLAEDDQEELVEEQQPENRNQEELVEEQQPKESENREQEELEEEKQVEEPKKEELEKSQEEKQVEELQKEELEEEKQVEESVEEQSVDLGSQTAAVELNAVEMNSDLHDLLEELQDADPFYIRSSPEFKNMKELLSTMVENLDRRGDFLDHEGLKELTADMKTLHTLTSEYLVMKQKEAEPSNNALRRMAVANKILDAANQYASSLSSLQRDERVVRDTDKLREMLEQSRRKETQAVELMPQGIGKEFAQMALQARERLETYACSQRALNDRERLDAQNCIYLLISNRLIQMQSKKSGNQNLEAEIPKIMSEVRQIREFNVDEYTKDPKHIAEFLNNHMENKMIKDYIAELAQIQAQVKVRENDGPVRAHDDPQLHHQESVSEKVK